MRVISVFSYRLSALSFFVLALMAILFLGPFGCGGGEGGEGPSTTEDIPTITSTTPADNAMDVSVGINVTVNFSEAMSTSSVEMNVTVSPDPGTEFFNWLAGDTQMVLSYTADLAQNTTYTVTVGAGSQDTEGTAMGSPYSFNFTTEDIPTVTSTTPADEATGISPGADITVSFSELMNTNSVQSAFSITPSPGTVNYSWSGTTLTINPDSSMAEATLYTVTVGASSQDAEGTVMGSPWSFDFTTGDIPTVTSTVPTDNATGVLLNTDIAITFSEPMDQASVQSALAITPSPGSVGYSWLSNTLTVNPDSSLADFTDYTVTVGGASFDAEGTALGSPYIFDFTTVTRPVVSGTIPANNDTAVATTTDITITFNKTMDQQSLENAIAISGYSDSVGTQSWNWLSGATLVISLSPDLASGTTYTVTVGAHAQDSGGTSMGATYNFTFSTGTVISGAIVSGTIFGDPESSHDDDLTDAYAVLFNDPEWGESGPPAVFLNTGSDGFYQFNFVQNGTYYPAALLDTNVEDWGPDPIFGDAIGEWPSSPGTALAVTGTDRTGIDITLVDPEAISGNAFYSGAYSSQLFLDEDLMRTLQVYAYESTTTVMFETEMILSSSPVPSVLYTVSDPTFGAPGEWFYWLNPYLMPELSVTGIPANGDTLTQTGDEYIPPGNYQVFGFMELHPALTSTNTYIMGFADNLAEIADTGDDAGGIDITLYDAVEVQGDVLQVGLGGDVAYTSATVTLLGWPLFAPISNEVLGSDISAWTYPMAPLGLPVVFHSEPDPADASNLMAVNKQYRVLEASDVWPNQGFELRVMERASMDSVATWAGTTIDSTRAQVAGTAWADSPSGNDRPPVTGVTVTISTGDQVEYMYSDFSFGAPFTQYSDPNFLIFNIDPPPDGKATLTFSHPDPSIVIDPVTIPLRADELTMFMHEVSDPNGVGPGVTIAGWVQDVGAGTLAGPGVTMTLTHEDGTVLETTLTDTNSEFAFYNVPSLMPVYLTSSYAGTGYVPLNTAVFGAGENTYIFEDGLPLGSGDVTFVNLIPGINEPAWNSTLQSLNWFVLEPYDSMPGGTQLGGVTFSTNAPGAQIYYWDTAADMYTSNGPSRAYTTSEIGTPAIGYAPNSSSGLFSFNATGTIVDSVNGVLMPGEALFWQFIQ